MSWLRKITALVSSAPPGRGTAPTPATAGPADGPPDFWAWFAAEAAGMRAAVTAGRGVGRRVVRPLRARLAALRPGVGFVVEADGAGGARLVITSGHEATGELTHVAWVEAFVARAPRVAGWEIIALRPALGAATGEIAVGTLVVGARTLTWAPAEDPARPGAACVRLFHDGADGPDAELLPEATELSLHNYLGERAMAEALDDYDLDVGPAPGEEALPLSALPAYLAEVAAERRRGLSRPAPPERFEAVQAMEAGTWRTSAVYDRALLEWPGRTGAPYLACVTIADEHPEAPPSEAQAAALDAFGRDLERALPRAEGHYLLGRLRAEGAFVVYVGTRDYRRAGAVLEVLAQAHRPILDADVRLYRDLGWADAAYAFGADEGWGHDTAGDLDRRVAAAPWEGEWW